MGNASPWRLPLLPGAFRARGGRGEQALLLSVPQRSRDSQHQWPPTNQRRSRIQCPNQQPARKGIQPQGAHQAIPRMHVTDVAEVIGKGHPAEIDETPVPRDLAVFAEVLDGQMRLVRSTVTDLSNVNNSATGTSNLAPSCSSVSNDGALIPRSMRLRKSTEIPTSSANPSCVSPRCCRMNNRRRPNCWRRWAISIA